MPWDIRMQPLNPSDLREHIYLITQFTGTETEAIEIES